eukprot:COSAG01_NODE_6898_length_3446_cov_9.549746_3_plen_67_part_00
MGAPLQMRSGALHGDEVEGEWSAEQGHVLVDPAGADSQPFCSADEVGSESRLDGLEKSNQFTELRA